jgi:hypothetical protein
MLGTNELTLTMRIAFSFHATYLHEPLIPSTIIMGRVLPSVVKRSEVSETGGQPSALRLQQVHRAPESGARCEDSCVECGNL